MTKVLVEILQYFYFILFIFVVTPIRRRLVIFIVLGLNCLKQPIFPSYFLNKSNNNNCNNSNCNNNKK